MANRSAKVKMTGMWTLFYLSGQLMQQMQHTNKNDHMTELL